MTDRRPCPCSRCNGALVALRTLQRHAAAARNQPILSFSAWSQQLAGATTTQPSRSSDSDVDSVGHSPGSSQHGIGYSRPSKRFRSSTVRLFSLCSILCRICIMSSPPMYALCTRVIHTYFSYSVVCLPEPEQNRLQDDPNSGADVGNHHERSPTPFDNDLDPLQSNSADGSTCLQLLFETD